MTLKVLRAPSAFCMNCLRSLKAPVPSQAMWILSVRARVTPPF